MVRAGLKWAMDKFKKDVNNNTFRDEDGNAPKIAGIKLLKIDGQRLHVILDPSKFDDNVAAAPKPAESKGVDKSDF